MNEKHNFEVLVKLLSEFWYKGDSSLDDELDKFEEAISKSGYGESAFGVARENYDRIEVIPDSKVKFYAEYYDGYNIIVNEATDANAVGDIVVKKIDAYEKKRVRDFKSLR